MSNKRSTSIIMRYTSAVSSLHPLDTLAISVLAFASTLFISALLTVYRRSVCLMFPPLQLQQQCKKPYIYDLERYLMGIDQMRDSGQTSIVPVCINTYIRAHMHTFIYRDMYVLTYVCLYVG